MSFFDRFLAEPQADTRAEGAQIQALAKQGWIPSAAEIDLAPIASEKAVVGFGEFLVYPDAVTFVVSVQYWDPAISEPLVPVSSQQLLRYGVAYSDGQAVSNVERHRGSTLNSDGQLNLHLGNGIHGSGFAHQRVWLTQVPPPGELEFFCHWPGVFSEAAISHSAESIRLAARSCHSPWS